MLVIPLQLIVHTMVNPIGARLQKQYSPKLIHVAAGILMAGSWLAAAYVTKWW